MKTPIAATLIMLASLAATTVSAYTFSPPNVSARLHGKLTFTPNEGANTKPFKCTVTFDLKTKTGEITAYKFPRGNCEVRFEGLPWYSDITGVNSGHFSFQGFGSGNGNCVADMAQFQDNGSGIFTFPAGQCLSGSLTSSPPVTIVP
jgi:hypothetical protein